MERRRRPDVNLRRLCRTFSYPGELAEFGPWVVVMDSWGCAGNWTRFPPGCLRAERNLQDQGDEVHKAV